MQFFFDFCQPIYHCQIQHYVIMYKVFIYLKLD